MLDFRRLFPVLLIGLSSMAAAANPGSVDFFEAKIRPVLIEHCYDCHNSDGADEGGFVSDYRDGIRRGGESGTLIVPGQPEESRLLAIIRHEIEGLEMPEGGPKLDDSVVSDFEAWIRAGAVDPRDEPPSDEERQQATSWEETLKRRKQWWSFQPIADVQPSQSASGNPIDSFIDQAIEQQQLTRSAPAEPEVLVRRLFVTLIGLPPTVEQARQWTERIAGAVDPKSKERVTAELVDTLLANKHFGERWARHWMDWIRYAESHGSEGDPTIDGAWHYRDYLIRAFNNDVSYDRLVREHIAGDLIDEPRINHDLGINESLIGTAHWRMVFHGFAPTDALDERVRFTDDQINVFSKAFLGLTVSCARCHDHKFDAISQKDYYAIYGILQSCRPGRAIADVPENLRRHNERLDHLKQQIKLALADQWQQSLPRLTQRLIEDDFDGAAKDSILGLLLNVKAELKTGRIFDDVWKQLQPRDSVNSDRTDSTKITQSWDLGRKEDWSDWYGVNDGFVRGTSAGSFAIEPDGDRLITGIYPAGVYSHLRSQKHPGRTSSVDIPLPEGQSFWVESIGDSGAAVRYVVHDYPRNGTVYPVKRLDRQWRWRSFDVSYWSGDQVHLEAATSRDAPLLVSGQDRSWYGIRRVVLADQSWSPPDQKTECLTALMQAVKSRPPHSLNDLARLYTDVLGEAITRWRSGTIDDSHALFLDQAVQTTMLDNRFEHCREARRAAIEYRKLEASIPVPIRIPSLDETGPENQPLMIRGNHKQLGEIVPRRFLEAIDSQPYHQPNSGRLELAADLLREDNPLTRRVVVNRLWHHLFGQGLVTTPDNFGRLGAKPTHPELLDYLANQFAEDSWSIKSMIRRIVLSEAWRRSSRADTDTKLRDPTNQFLARANLRRLEAEAIRDHLLSISGELNDELFGPPVKANIPRRGLYVNVVRNSLDPFLRAFDFPEPFSTVGSRPATNIPAQSLALMNDAAVARSADQWARRILEQPSMTNDRDRITQMFRQAFSREVSAEEIDQAVQFVRQAEREIEILIDKREALTQRQANLDREIEAAFTLARKQLTTPSPGQERNTPSVQPIASWDFTKNTDDLIGDLNASLQGDASIGPNGLAVGSKAYAVAGPIPRPIGEKTLEAYVKLSDLDQRGGGVLTLQSPDGRVFDSIVFAEREPGRWMSGSDHHRRSENVGGQQETEAAGRPVHLVITYHADGRIILYRDGVRYGQPSIVDGPVMFAAGEAMVSFGVRHLPAVGNRSLSGHVLRAAVYDLALTDRQVGDLAKSTPKYISERLLLETMSPKQSELVRHNRRQRQALQPQVDSLASIGNDPRRQAYTELAKAMFLLKEFIYVR
ncbi:DUF1553 domain-containing protein [Roseiconus lacunae]|uniref:DUF1553 domain-containing protein n=1 Tax=Roseiconus lacunae TaxID=2605694 RepID=UPI003088861C|nr:DUF1553 domain-containing protein [Stieleria sp. HD01]